MPKQKNTKERIIEAAIDLIAENGYKGASVRKIAAKVGIRESAIYNHFKNKEDILKNIFSEIFSTPFEMRDIEERAKKGKSFLHQYAVAYKLVSFDKKMEKLFRVMMIELFQNEDLRESFLKEFHQKEMLGGSDVYGAGVSLRPILHKDNGLSSAYRLKTYGAGSDTFRKACRFFLGVCGGLEKITLPA